MSLWWNLIVAEKTTSLQAHIKEGNPSCSSWARDTSHTECMCVHQDLPLPEAFPEWGCITLNTFFYDELPKGILSNAPSQNCKFIHFVLHFVAGGEKMVLFQKCWYMQTEGKIKGTAASSLFPDHLSSPRAPASSSSSDIPRHKS